MIDLAPDLLTIVERILAEYVPECEVRAYGSRVTWTAQDYSDLDLAVISDRPLNQSVMGRLKEAFEESSLPIRVDILDWHSIPNRFQDEIDREYVVLQKGSKAWRSVRLGDVAHVNTANYSSNDGWTYINYLDTSSITENRISNIKQLILGQDKIPSRARRKVKPGDIVYSTVRPNQRHYGLLKEIPDNCLASTGFVVLNGREGCADSGYLYWYLTQEPVVSYLQMLAENSTSAYPSIRPADLKSLTISLPPLGDQQTIARVLGTLDDKIELNRRMSETLEEMARALFKSWFVDFDPVRAKMEGRWQPGESLPGLPAHLYDLFPDRLIDSKLGEIPDGWRVGTIEDVIEVNPRRKVRRGELATHVAMAAMPTSSPHIAGWTRRSFTSGSRFVNGDTLLARITPSLENGKTALVDFLDDHETGWGSTELVVLRPKNPWPPAFAYLLARLPAFRKHAIINMTGTSGRQRVPPKAIASYSLTVAPNNVGVAFSKVVQSLFESTTWINRQSKMLAEMRDALLPKLVSGEVRVFVSGTPAPPMLAAFSE